MFLSPAWSLSLEWQFYIVAPFIIHSIKTPKDAFIAAIITIAMVGLYQANVFGDFRLHSILPGAGIFFAVGIGARMFLPRLPRLTTYPLAFLLIMLGCTAYGYKTIPFAIFVFVITYLLVDKPKDTLGAITEKLLHACLDSKIATYLGKISYSTYLIHAPIIQFTIYLTHITLGLTFWQTFATLVVTVPIVTLCLSALINRYIETPCIAVGKKLFPHLQSHKAHCESDIK